MLMASLLLEGKHITRNMAQAVEYIQFAANFPTAEGEAARKWLTEMERKTGKKLTLDEDEDFTDTESATAIAEEAKRAEAARKAK